MKQKIVDKQVEELKEKQYQVKTRANELENEINQSPARRFLPLVTKAGNFRGEIKYLTKAQYKKYLRKEPNPAILDKSGRVPWHYAFDELASEAGYKSDEDFKEAIERISAKKKELDTLKHEGRYTRGDIEKTKKSVPKIIVTNLKSAEPPVFKKDENTTAIVTEVNGLEMKATRNPSFWQVGDNNPATPDFRVRHAEQARQLMNNAAKGHQEDIARQRGIKLSRQAPRISKRMPRISKPMPRISKGWRGLR